MINKIFVDDCIVEKNSINYKYRVFGPWKKYFTEKEFEVKFACSVDEVPYSIAIIPLLGTLLPISWIFDGQIYVDEIDKTFIQYIPKIKESYQQMYPNLSFKGIIEYNKAIDNESNVTYENYATMFSGGADATQTLINHINENPVLLSVWGADVDIENSDAWNLVKSFILDVSQEYGLDLQIIKSTFRKTINESEISSYVIEKTGIGWWLGFYHSLGLLCLTAPLAYKYKYKYIYIASTHTKEDDVPCASHPSVDNNIKFGNCSVVHDGFELSREMKIENIVKYSNTFNKKINIRVCWESIDGQNCCHCEKCGRTMLEFISLGEDPKNYGFNYTKENIREIIYNLKYGNILLKPDLLNYYIDIQNNIKSISRKKFPLYFWWLYNCDLTKIENASFRKKTIGKKIRRYIERRGFE